MIMISVMTATNHPHDTYRRVCEQTPAALEFCETYLFPGHCQHPTPVVDARGAVFLMNVLPCHNAAMFRLRCAYIVVRYLGGDEKRVTRHISTLVLPMC